MVTSHPPLASRILQLGAFLVDLDQRLVHRGDDSVPLTRLEADLLRHLAERRGRWVQRERLLGAVWGYSPRVVSRAVDHAVCRLRRKIEENSADPRWLTSVRGGGYRLEPEVPDQPPARGASTSLRRLADLIDAADLLSARAVAPEALSVLAATLWVGHSD